GIGADAVVVPVPAAERRLGGGTAADRVLLRIQALAPFLLGPRHVGIARGSAVHRTLRGSGSAQPKPRWVKRALQAVHRGLPASPRSGKLAAGFRLPGSPVRPALRLLPLSLCIALSLQARAADDMPPNWALCPVQDVVKPFADAQSAPEGLNIDNSQQATEIEGDALSGTVDNPVYNGNVTLRRGDQFLGADQLTFNSEQEHYTAEGSIRYQGSGLRMTAARAEGDQ